MQYTSKDSEKNKKNNLISTLINIYLIATIIISIMCTYSAYTTKVGGGVPSLFGYEIMSVQSNSMVPVFEKGDLVISKKVRNVSDLNTGDIISFWTIVNGERIINTHRIYSIEEASTYTYFVTKGDANSVPDAMSVMESDVVGAYRTRIKSLGNAMDFLQTSKGFFIVVVIPVLIFFMYYLINFINVYLEYKKIKQRVKFEKEHGIYNPATDNDLNDSNKTSQLTPEQIELLLQKAQGQQIPQGQQFMYGQPMYNQPMPGQPMPGQFYGQPMYGPQMLNQFYGQPMYGQPMPGQPMPSQFYGQPMPGQFYGQPMYGPQMQGQPMQGYGQTAISKDDLKTLLDEVLKETANKDNSTKEDIKKLIDEVLKETANKDNSNKNE